MDPAGVKSATSAFGEVFLVAQIEKKIDLLWLGFKLNKESYVERDI